MSSERWKPVYGYEGLYEVSDLGRIKSVYRKSPRGDDFITVPEKILTPSIHQSGYLRINLRKENKTNSHYVHVLVLETFKCKRPNKQDVDHRDSNRKNNTLSNLRWLDRRQNRGKGDFTNPNKLIRKKLKNYEQCK